MFGFLQGSRCDQAYRQVYAGCCSVQHKRFGIESLVFLSYESIFLYLFALDDRQCDAPPEDAATCCRLRTSRKVLDVVDHRFADFSAAFGILLASIKLNDDVQDDRSWTARFFRWRLNRRIQKAYDYFVAFDPEFQSRVTGYLRRHAELERDDNISLEEYVEPTAEAFGYVFGLFGRLWNDETQVANASESLTEIGRLIGAAIISFDCAADWDKDRRKGAFNPLPNERAVNDAIVFSQRCLAEAIWLCAGRFEKPLTNDLPVLESSQQHSRSRCIGVLRETFDRLTSYGKSSDPTPSRVRSIGYATQRGWRVLRRGDCDCCCIGCEACGVCEGCGAAEGCSLGCCEGGGGCCCDCSADFCFICHDDDCCGKKRRRQSDQQNQQGTPANSDPMVGLFGVTVGVMNPVGVVEIKGQRYPARSEVPWLDGNVAVEVVSREPGGLVVRPR